MEEVNASSHLCQYGDEVAVKVHGLIERQQDRLICPGEEREIGGVQSDAFKVDRGVRAPISLHLLYREFLISVCYKHAAHLETEEGSSP